MGLGGCYVVRSGAARRTGRPSIAQLVSAFVIGTDMPTKATIGAGKNGTSTTWTTYSGTGAGTSFTPAGQVFTDVDFGQTKLACSPIVGTVTFNNCKWTNSGFGAVAMVTNFGDTCNLIFNDCTFVNVGQSAWSMAAFNGNRAIFNRCSYSGWADSTDIVASASN